MARLKSNGTELLRVTREWTFGPQEHTVLKDGTDLGLSLTTWERVTRAHMSNGKILFKRDVRFRPDRFNPNGRYYSWGWKLYGRCKPGIDPKAHADKMRQFITEGRSKWQLDSDRSKPVVISQARIERAARSGESVGFCKACGAKAHNVEPDAERYTCESCGKPEVYGAEQMLF